MLTLVLMSGKWYAMNYADEDDLRDIGLDNLFAHVNNGEVVCVTDDLETWCGEMNIEQSEVIIAGAE